jgi:ribonuclease Z
LKVTFIGTGSGKTSLKRYHSALLLSFDRYNLLVDAGDGISRALLNANVNYNSINGILFTHLHPDHFSGLGALLVQMKMFSRTEHLEIFIFEKYVKDVKKFLISCNLIPEKMGFEISYKPFYDDKEFYVDNDFEVIPRENSHLEELIKYNQYSKQRFYSASFLFSFKGKNFLYTADIGSAEDLVLFNDFRLDALISEITHIKISELLQKIEFLGSPHTYLIHIPENEDEILKVLAKSGDRGKKIVIASDRQTIEI